MSQVQEVYLWLYPRTRNVYSWAYTSPLMVNSSYTDGTVIKVFFVYSRNPRTSQVHAVYLWLCHRTRNVYSWAYTSPLMVNSSYTEGTVIKVWILVCCCPFKKAGTINQNSVLLFVKRLSIWKLKNRLLKTCWYWYVVTGLDKHFFQHKVVNIFLTISFIICFGCSKEPSHWDGSFEYPKHMFWLRNKKISFSLRERSGSVVECLTRDRRAAGSSLTGVTALWSLSKTHLS